MSTVVMVVVVIIVIAAVAGGGFVLWTQSRTRRLKSQFGPEYDRAVERHGGRGAAERELLTREQRHQELELRELDPRRREEARAQWTHVQERFVDAPKEAVAEADRLVTSVMGERGYPTGDFDENVTHLSVEHGQTIDHYRRGHELSTRSAEGSADTEDLRQAMVHYRALFEDLLAIPEGERAAAPDPDLSGTRPDTPAEHREAPAEHRADARPDTPAPPAAPAATDVPAERRADAPRDEAPAERGAPVTGTRNDDENPRS
ncbi:hypothetical protein [Actinomadura flavalba]|uniref:hypothetical protein n=1 Tax=Actinomadura flavalba TaxID=1120938 RepID=UPI00038197AB|nr:hypothetical protein [Actinomadura flavalba]